MRSNRTNSFFFQNYPDIWISGDAYLTEVVIYRAVEEVPRGRVAPPMDLKLVGQSLNPLRHLKRFRNLLVENVAGSSTGNPCAGQRRVGDQAHGGPSPRPRCSGMEDILICPKLGASDYIMHQRGWGCACHLGP